MTLNHLTLPEQGPETWAPILEPSFEKLRRAYNVIRKVEEAIEQYIASRPVQFRADGRPSFLPVSLAVVKNIPISTMLDVGDAVHQLRSALDHCVWALWTLDGADLTSRLQFPVSRKSKIDYDRIIRNFNPRFADSRNMLASLECFPTGTGDSIVRLTELDNMQKHRVIVPATISVSITGVKLSRNGEPAADDPFYRDLSIHFTTKQFHPDIPGRFEPLYGVQWVDQFPKNWGARWPTWQDAKYQFTIVLEGNTTGTDMRNDLMQLAAHVWQILHKFRETIDARSKSGRSCIIAPRP